MYSHKWNIYIITEEQIGLEYILLKYIYIYYYYTRICYKHIFLILEYIINIYLIILEYICWIWNYTQIYYQYTFLCWMHYNSLYFTGHVINLSIISGCAVFIFFVKIVYNFITIWDMYFS